MLKNPAYEGRACYGKTEPGPPTQRANRTRRRKGIYARLSPVKRPRPQEEWIAIAVPALVSKESFALAQERLKLNKQLSARRTKSPSILQGLLVCAECGYALCRMSTTGCGAGQRYYYYRCAGSHWRQPAERRCKVRPVRVEQLDQFVWEQVWQLLNEPELIQREIQRRLQEYHAKTGERVGRKGTRIKSQRCRGRRESCLPRFEQKRERQPV